MNNLKRELAPISTAAWQEIDAEATRVLKLKLAGRKLVDFEGPLGPTEAAVNTGRRERLGAAPVADVEASRRQVLPLVELRAYFDLSREEMDAVERGAKDPELQPLIDAATRSPTRRTPRSSTATRPGASRGSTRSPPIRSCRFPTTTRTIPGASRRRRGSCVWPASTAPTPSRWDRAPTPASPRRSATVATRS